MNKRAFTMVELMVVCGILLLVIIPTYRSMTYSSRTFEKNVSRNETMQTGQRIINLLKRDLSSISYNFSGNSERIDISNLLKTEENGFRKTYSFYSFAGTAEVAGKFENKLNRIKYIYDGDHNTLSRTIIYNSTGANASKGEKNKVLSKFVNHFELLPVIGNSHGVKRSFLRPFFQLIEPVKKNSPGKVVIREFMTTIVPDSFNSMLAFNSYNRNFHTDPEADSK